MNLRITAMFVCATTVLASMWMPVASAAATATTRRVSVSNSDKQSPDGGIYESISGSGRFVAFESASRLVAADTNAESDVFVRDRHDGSTERVSVRTNGNQGNSWSGYSAISANGRFVTFTAEATNLVTGDTNGAQDIFVHDRQTGTTTRISVNSRGREGNGDSSSSSISGNGRYVAFASAATNLVKGDTNGYNDLFLHDRQTGVTTRINVSSSGVQANGGGTSYLQAGQISAGGRVVVFDSDATNLVPHDTNASSDVFVHDRVTGKTRRASVSSGGEEGNDDSGAPSVSGDGNVVSFSSVATNLIGGDVNGDADIFVRSLDTGKTTRVSVSTSGNEGNDASQYSSLSVDGRFVAFDSYATNLIGSDTNGAADVFVRDRKTGRTRRASVAANGDEGDAGGEYPFIAAGGRFVAFQSGSTNLVADDTNATGDVFVRGPSW
jgi:hypothetical protein